MVIDTFHSNYRLHKCREKPSLVQRRLDRVISTLLTSELEQKLSGIAGNDYYLFIKQVNVSLAIDLSTNDDAAIAALWADAIHSEIMKKINFINSITPGFIEQENIILFPNTSTFYAFFIRDLIQGDVWNTWYYKEFEGLEKMGKGELIQLILKKNRDKALDILLIIEEMGFLKGFLKGIPEYIAAGIYLHSLEAVPFTQTHRESTTFTKALQEAEPYIMSLKDSAQAIITGSTTSYKYLITLYLLFRKTYPDFSHKVSLKDIIRKIVFKTKDNVKSIDDEVKQAEKGQEQAKPLSGHSEKEQEQAKSLSGHSENLVSRYGGLFFLIPSIVKIKLHTLAETASFPGYKSIAGSLVFLFFTGLAITQNRIPLPGQIDPAILLFAGLPPATDSSFHPPGTPVEDLNTYPETVEPEIIKTFTGELIKTVEVLKAQSAYYMDYVDMEMLQKDCHVPDYMAMVNTVTGLVYRIFAGHLRGFEKSSMDYLFSNFIKRSSLITIKKKSLSIQMGKKPLDMVLRIAGLTDSGYYIPWSGNREVTIVIR